jgi:hypothetical protein
MRLPWTPGSFRFTSNFVSGLCADETPGPESGTESVCCGSVGVISFWPDAECWERTAVRRPILRIHFMGQILAILVALSRIFFGFGTNDSPVTIALLRSAAKTLVVTLEDVFSRERKMMDCSGVDNAGIQLPTVSSHRYGRNCGKWRR